MSMRLVSIGADPEVFVRKNGELAAAIGSIGGEKGKPVLYGNTELQEDNVLLEFTTRPAATSGDFQYYITQAKSDMDKACKALGMQYVIESSNEYTREALEKYGPKALEFGCDPDVNAYTGTDNPSPDNNTLLRTAGGHVHLGINQPLDPADKGVVARACDLFLGVPSVLMDPDVRRRELYGKAGAYRSKSYGIEYRSLSNFWIRNRQLVAWVYRQSDRAVQASSFFDVVAGADAPLIIDCINRSDREIARHLCNKYNLEVLNDRA